MDGVLCEVVVVDGKHQVGRIACGFWCLAAEVDYSPLLYNAALNEWRILAILRKVLVTSGREQVPVQSDANVAPDDHLRALSQLPILANR